MADEIAPFVEHIDRLAEIELEDDIRRFFEAVLKPSTVTVLRDILGLVLKSRPGVSVEHLPFLLWVSCNYVVSDESRELLVGDVQRLLEDHRGELIRLLCTQNVNAHFVSRYSGLHALVELYNSAGIRPNVLELGCSAGMGLQSVGTSIHKRLVETSSPRILDLLRSQPQVNSAVGIDLLEASFDWRWMEASLRPNRYFDEFFDSFASFADWLRTHGSPISRFTADIFALSTYRDHVLEFPPDIVWTSNVLYELGGTKAELRDRVRELVMEILPEPGIWIDADYRSWNTKFGSIGNPYEYRVHSVHTGRSASIDEFVVFQAKDDRVRELSEGPDFERFDSLLRES